VHNRIGALVCYSKWCGRFHPCAEPRSLWLLRELTMPSLSFFIDEHDLRLLLDRLNADPEIAFIVPEVVHESENRKLDEPSISLEPALQVHRLEDGTLELKGNAANPDAGKRFEP